MRRNTVLTVTLNPCLDRFLTVERLVPGKTHRVLSARTDAGGKGINVSRLLNDAGIQTHALAIASGAAGQTLSSELQRLHIAHTFFSGTGETRTNLKILDAQTGVMTECNEPGAPAGDAAERLTEKLEQLLPDAAALALCGSIPPGVPVGIYANLANLANQFEVPVFLDASGAALAVGAAASPYAVKPNRAEFLEWTGAQSGTIADIAARMFAVQQSGIPFVTVSLGSEGALFLRDGQFLHAAALPINACSPAAAGDAMVAMACHAMLLRMPLHETAQLMTAAGALTAARPGTQMANFEDIIHAAPSVQIKTIK